MLSPEHLLDLRQVLPAEVHVGPIVSSHVFYDPDPGTFARWKRVGHIGVEMEAAMMYTVAAINGLEALAMMTVSDILERELQERYGIQPKRGAL